MSANSSGSVSANVLAVIVAMFLAFLLGWSYAYKHNEEKELPSQETFMPDGCMLDNSQLERLEADLLVAQRIAWDWITVEAQCTCNSPWSNNAP
jgi:hypothetical protein